MYDEWETLPARPKFKPVATASCAESFDAAICVASASARLPKTTGTRSAPIGSQDGMIVPGIKQKAVS